MSIPNRIVDLSIIGQETPSPSPAPIENFQDKIVFSSDRDGNYKIYVMDLDGSNVSLLIDNAFNNQRPRISKDGRKICWYHDGSGQNEVYVYDIETQLITQITNNLGLTPDFDINGNIVYDKSPGLFIMAAGETEPLGDTPVFLSNALNAATPRYSKAGDKIAYVNFAFPYSIRSINPDNTGDQLIASTGTNTLFADWFSDDSGILFTRQISNTLPSSEIYKQIPAVSGTQTRLTTDALEDSDPVPDTTDTYVYFMEIAASNPTYFKIVRINLSDGGDPTEISNYAGNYNDKYPHVASMLII